MTLYWLGLVLGTLIGALTTVTVYRWRLVYQNHRETVRELETALYDTNRCFLCPEPHDGWPSALQGRHLCTDCWEAECSKSWWDNLCGPESMIVMDLDDDDSH